MRTGLVLAALAPLVACGEPPDDADTGNVGQAEDLPTVTVGAEPSFQRPCLECEQHAQEIASAAAQAQRRAMQAAEAKARALREMTAARIQACVTAKNTAITACNKGIQQSSARAAAARAVCNLQPVCTGNTLTAQRNACISQGNTQCADHLHSCVASVPLNAPGISGAAISNALAACNATFGQPCTFVEVPRSCQSVTNFGGFGSLDARCRDYQQANCAEPEAAALASSTKELANCLANAFLVESQCLGHPTMVMM